MLVPANSKKGRGSRSTFTVAQRGCSGGNRYTAAGMGRQVAGRWWGQQRQVAPKGGSGGKVLVGRREGVLEFMARPRTG